MKRLVTTGIVILTGFWSALLLGTFAASIGKVVENHNDVVEFLFWSALDDLEVGCAEEAIFRYLVMDLLFTKVLKLSDNVALALSSLLFGLAHLLNGPGHLPQVFEAIAMGAVLGYLYRRLGLWAPIFVHASFNFFVLSMIPIMSGRYGA